MISTPLYYWAPAPNRHVDPLLSALRSFGVLRHEYYGGDSLRWTQLGTASAASPDVRTVLPGANRDAIRELIRRSDAHGFHLVHGMRDFSAIATTMLAEAGRPYFVMAESPLPRPWLSPKRALRDAYYARQLRGAKGAFAVSRFAAEAFLSFGVARCRIAPAAYPVPADHRDGAKSGGERPRIVFCGRAIPRKGLDILAHALTILRSTNTRFVFDFVGAGAGASAFLSKLKSSDVPYTDHGAVLTSGVFQIMSGSAMVVVPSLLWEGWGYVVNEAVACGVPVVASTIVGANELIVPGISGFEFQQGDAVALRHAIRAQLNAASNDETADRAFTVLQRSAGPSEVASHLLESMRAMANGSSVPEAPWHRAVRSMGGNSATDWWASFTNGIMLPPEPKMPERILRQI